jgi:hypothetical protein
MPSVAVFPAPEIRQIQLFTADNAMLSTISMRLILFAILVLQTMQSALDVSLLRPVWNVKWDIILIRYPLVSLAQEIA